MVLYSAIFDPGWWWCFSFNTALRSQQVRRGSPEKDGSLSVLAVVRDTPEQLSTTPVRRARLNTSTLCSCRSCQSVNAMIRGQEFRQTSLNPFRANSSLASPRGNMALSSRPLSSGLLLRRQLRSTQWQCKFMLDTVSTSRLYCPCRFEG